jgi:hypothetical protein
MIEALALAHLTFVLPDRVIDRQPIALFCLTIY